MSIQVNINIKGSQVKLMTDYYMKHLSALKDKRKVVDLEISEVEDIIQQLSNQSESKIEKKSVVPPQLELLADDSFSIKWPIHQKITYVLEKAGRPMPTRDIVESLMVLDSSLHADKEKAAKNISTVLSIKKGELYERESVNNEYVYRVK